MLPWTIVFEYRDLSSVREGLPRAVQIDLPAHGAISDIKGIQCTRGAVYLLSNDHTSSKRRAGFIWLIGIVDKLQAQTAFPQERAFLCIKGVETIQIVFIIALRGVAISLCDVG